MAEADPIQRVLLVPITHNNFRELRTSNTVISRLSAQIEHNDRVCT